MPTTLRNLARYRRGLAHQPIAIVVDLMTDHSSPVGPGAANTVDRESARAPSKAEALNEGCIPTHRQTPSPIHHLHGFVSPRRRLATAKSIRQAFSAPSAFLFPLVAAAQIAPLSAAACAVLRLGWLPTAGGREAFSTTAAMTAEDSRELVDQHLMGSRRLWDDAKFSAVGFR